jgi:hypothetical protein
MLENLIRLLIIFFLLVTTLFFKVQVEYSLSKMLGTRSVSDLYMRNPFMFHTQLVNIWVLFRV